MLSRSDEEEEKMMTKTKTKTKKNDKNHNEEKTCHEGLLSCSHSLPRIGKIWQEPAEQEVTSWHEDQS